MNKRHYEHTLPNIRGSLSNTYVVRYIFKSEGVTTTHGRVFAISPPRVGSNSTQYTPYCSTMSNPQTFHPQTHQG